MSDRPLPHVPYTFPRQDEEESRIPWGTILTLLALGGGGLALWKYLRNRGGYGSAVPPLTPQLLQQMSRMPGFNQVAAAAQAAGIGTGALLAAAAAVPAFSHFLVKQLMQPDPAALQQGLNAMAQQMRPVLERLDPRSSALITALNQTPLADVAKATASGLANAIPGPLGEAMRVMQTASRASDEYRKAYEQYNRIMGDQGTLARGMDMDPVSGVPRDPMMTRVLSQWVPGGRGQAEVDAFNRWKGVLQQDPNMAGALDAITSTTPTPDTARLNALDLAKYQAFPAYAALDMPDVLRTSRAIWDISPAASVLNAAFPTYIAASRGVPAIASAVNALRSGAGATRAVAPLLVSGSPAAAVVQRGWGPALRSLFSRAGATGALRWGLRRTPGLIALERLLSGLGETVTAQSLYGTVPLRDVLRLRATPAEYARSLWAAASRLGTAQLLNDPELLRKFTNPEEFPWYSRWADRFLSATSPSQYAARHDMFDRTLEADTANAAGAAVDAGRTATRYWSQLARGNTPLGQFIRSTRLPAITAEHLRALQQRAIGERMMAQEGQRLHKLWNTSQEALSGGVAPGTLEDRWATIKQNLRNAARSDPASAEAFRRRFAPNISFKALYGTNVKPPEVRYNTYDRPAATPKS